ncbi:MAG: cold shock domain-containing protein [Litoreibacter sp.]|uniref:cold-shock protein n=1 Tax=Litoreibacter sp. TaxID=1969459 RepID=UPI003297B013
MIENLIDEVPPATVTRQISGQLKWFDRTKGFGFLTAPEYDEDIFLHRSVLDEAVCLILLEGSTLEVMVEELEKGVRVTEILSVKQVGGDDEISALESIEAIPARVKWYDPIKGFGFANAFRGIEDIFIHSSILERYGIKELIACEAVGLRVQYTERGPIAVDVCDWVPIATEIA